MSETTDVIQWLVGLQAALKNEGQPEAAGVIKEMIGEDGQGGVAKVLADYNKDNKLIIGDMKLPLVIHKEDGTSEKIEVELKFSDNPILDGIVKGILVGAVGTTILAVGK